MKKIIVQLFVISVLLLIVNPSCTIEIHNEKACFSTDYSSYEVGESIRFYNCTDPSADSYFWDFGDQTTSSYDEPIHEYTYPGIYTVFLTAYYGDREVTYSQDIEIMESYSLKVVAYYEGTSDFMPGADIILYATEQDWQQDRNRIAQGITNNYGEVIFDTSTGVNLYNQAYYVYASKDDYNGYYSNKNSRYKTDILERGANVFSIDMRFFSTKKK